MPACVERSWLSAGEPVFPEFPVPDEEDMMAASSSPKSIAPPPVRENAVGKDEPLPPPPPPAPAEESACGWVEEECGRKRSKEEGEGGLPGRDCRIC